MKLRTALALAVAALTIGVPVAAADPDGYQPQLKAVEQPDAFGRYLRNNAPAQQPDAFDRYLQNNSPEITGAAAHPDSRSDRPTATSEVAPVGDDGRDWTTGALGALGGALFVVLAIVGASAIRERRQPALR